MLSYRHAFHAGNHADVLKHFVLTELIRYFCQKETAFWFVDTHACAGVYALDTGYATKLAEHVDGIGRENRKFKPLFSLSTTLSPAPQAVNRAVFAENFPRSMTIRTLQQRESPHADAL